MAIMMMRFMTFISILLSAHLVVVSAIPWTGPSPTIPVVGGLDVSPVFTSAPELPSHELVKRDADAGICGWIGGNSSESLLKIWHSRFTGGINCRNRVLKMCRESV